MARCGLCGGTIGNTLVKHGEICPDDMQAPSVKFQPELDDLQRMEDESE